MPKETKANSAGLSLGVSGPPYFRILWDRELEELRPVLESVAKHRDEILSNWHRQYEVHLGDSRVLSEAEFFELFGHELDESMRFLLDRDMAGFVDVVRREAEKLAEREVPYFEVVISLHLFEESVARSLPGLSPLPPVYLAFDKLSHIRTIVLADTYFRVRSSLLKTRIQDLEREAARLPLKERQHFHGLIGGTEVMRQLYERISMAGHARGTILIVGETGTGKELVARAIHEVGETPLAPFIPFNCAAIPRELAESELFGYKRGAFSGASVEFLGLFRAAEGGTLFLDEITEMAPETQSKLLRVLQEHAVRPVGSSREIPVNLRVVASTNRDPEEAVRARQLREDLYYRLQANVLRIPPLRERLDDVALLVEHFIELFNQRLNRDPPIAGLEARALEAMRRYEWLGNVRELANAIETAFTFGRYDKIRLADLPAPIRGEPEIEISARTAATRAARAGSFAEAERDVIRRALETTNRNKVQTAKLLGISRKKLYAKIKEYGL